MAITTKELWESSKPAPQTSQEIHPADSEYTPPVSVVKLPSAGAIYPPESPLYLSETLDIKGVTAHEEDILSSPVLIKSGKVLTTLMKACITNRLVDPDKMLVGDRNAVLVAIRVSAYGPKYSASITCPACAHEVEAHEFDLSRLNLKTLDEEPVGGRGNNRFQFILPVSKRVVEFRLMDAETVNKVEKDTEAARKIGQERGVTARLMAQVLSLQGTEQKHLPKALSNLAAQDSRALRNHMDKIAPGVDMTQQFECPSCGNESEVEIPIGTEFFWPTEV